MKTKKLIFIMGAILLSACNKLNVKPISIIQDGQIFTSAGGVQAYFAGLYNRLPIEDNKFSNGSGYFQFGYADAVNMFTGEGTNKNQGGWVNMTSNGGTGNTFYYDAFYIIRQANYFIQTMPQYASSVTPAQVNNWLGEAYFIRAFVYFELAKRYGGVPIILTTQNYPAQSLNDLQVPRNSEQEVFDQIGIDLDKSINMMGATSENRGRANKYVAAALKSRAMLFAGSIAKYNTRNLVDPATNKRVEGIPATAAIAYFKASYAASVLVQAGGYILYRNTAATDKVGNYVNLFYDASSANKEVIFAREYSYGNTGSSYDVFAVPHQMQPPIGYTSYIDPTEDYVELFDGIPKNPDGTLMTTDANGNYIYYGVTPTTPQVPYSTLNTVNTAAPTGSNIITDAITPSSNNVVSNEYAIFQNAEPRLLATVIVPGATFKGEIIDIRRGIYNGSITNGIPQFNVNSTTPYTGVAGMVACTALDGTPNVNIANPAINVPANTIFSSGGLSGIYGSRNAGTITGFLIRKYSNQTYPTAYITSASTVTPFMEIRYAEIELNRAEADWELNAAGQNDVNYMQDAFTMINDLRDRAGAVLLTSTAGLSDVNVIRKERKKELGFENKIYWDLIRWRTFDAEMNNRVVNVLNPVYVVANGKYIYDRRPYEGNVKMTFPIASYYQQLPSTELTKNPKLIQNQ